MGIAEAIPGVSGGTIAFITGIYQELIETIKSITPSNLSLLFKDIKVFWKTVNGSFLLFLLGGMAAGLLIGVVLITHLIETQKEPLWGFFFGLVLASAVYLGKNVKWEAKSILLAISGAILSYIITTLTPSSGSENLFYIFFAGSIAVSALMLPGISGSFILLLFGLYHIVIGSLKDVLSGDISDGQLLTLAVLAAGILTGLFSFARILSYLFNNYANSTMGFLIGILLGSLNKLWPWKFIKTAFNKETTEVVEINNVSLPNEELFKILDEINVVPAFYQSFENPKLAIVVLSFIMGLILVGLMSYLDGSKEA